MIRKIAVVGGGLAGVSLSYFLLQYPDVEVTLFDQKGVAAGASGIGSGLLHPFPARNALRAWMSREGMEATKFLLNTVEAFLGKPVSQNTGVLRIAIDPRQTREYKERALEDPDAILFTPDQVKEKLPGAIDAYGLWIPQGMTVWMTDYLQGLHQLSTLKGLKTEITQIQSTSELNGFDQIVLATGYQTLFFPECAHLPLDANKGHTLICRSKGEPLPCGVVSVGHIAPTEDPALCQLGSTYERPITTLLPESSAIEVLKEKVSAFYPPARDFEVVELRAGVRIAQIKNYRPIAERLGPNLWVFTALGSRGLLYHALFAEKLAREIVEKELLNE